MNKQLKLRAVFIVIPATVTLGGNDLRARGEFTINRGEYAARRRHHRRRRHRLRGTVSE